MLFAGEVVLIRVRYVSPFSVLTRLMGAGILSFLCLFLVGVVAVLCVCCFVGLLSVLCCFRCFVVLVWFHPIGVFYFHTRAVKFVVVTLVIVGTRFGCRGDPFLSIVVMDCQYPRDQPQPAREKKQT